MPTESPDPFKSSLPSSVLKKASSDAVSENERRTSADSSASTWRARRAEDASRWVGRGTEIVLAGVSRDRKWRSIGYSYSEQGKAVGSGGFKCSCVPIAGSIEERERLGQIAGAIGGRWCRELSGCPVDRMYFLVFALNTNID